jgi:hypothetical protein
VCTPAHGFRTEEESATLFPLVVVFGRRYPKDAVPGSVQQPVRSAPRAISFSWSYPSLNCDTATSRTSTVGHVSADRGTMNQRRICPQAVLTSAGITRPVIRETTPNAQSATNHHTTSVHCDTRSLHFPVADTSVGWTDRAATRRRRGDSFAPHPRCGRARDCRVISPDAPLPLTIHPACSRLCRRWSARASRKLSTISGDVAGLEIHSARS